MLPHIAVIAGALVVSSVGIVMAWFVINFLRTNSTDALDKALCGVALLLSSVLIIGSIIIGVGFTTGAITSSSEVTVTCTSG